MPLPAGVPRGTPGVPHASRPSRTTRPVPRGTSGKTPSFAVRPRHPHGRGRLAYLATSVVPRGTHARISPWSHDVRPGGRRRSSSGDRHPPSHRHPPPPQRASPGDPSALTWTALGVAPLAFRPPDGRTPSSRPAVAGSSATPIDHARSEPSAASSSSQRRPRTRSEARTSAGRRKRARRLGPSRPPTGGLGRFPPARLPIRRRHRQDRRATDVGHAGGAAPATAIVRGRPRAHDLGRELRAPSTRHIRATPTPPHRGQAGWRIGGAHRDTAPVLPDGPRAAPGRHAERPGACRGGQNSGRFTGIPTRRG
jgi:hypothetical protein